MGLLVSEGVINYSNIMMNASPFINTKIYRYENGAGTSIENSSAYADECIWWIYSQWDCDLHE